MIEPAEYLKLAVEVSAISIAAYAVIAVIRSDIRAINIELKFLNDSHKEHAEKLEIVNGIVTTLAVNEVRFNNLEQRINDLAHGNGFVLPFPSQAQNG